MLALAAGSGGAAAQTGGGAPAPHPPPAPGGAVESSDTMKRVTTRVLCMCGGCVNQTLHECTCGTAAMERDQVSAAIASGKSPDEVIQGYVEEYGLQVLVTPERTGFNLIGWLVPFIVTLAALAVLTYVLRGWVRGAAAEATQAPVRPDDPDDRRYRERLERELKDFKA